jgi:hypothetical protein
VQLALCNRAKPVMTRPFRVVRQLCDAFAVDQVANVYIEFHVSSSRMHRRAAN